MVLSRSTELDERAKFIQAVSAQASSIDEQRVRNWATQETRKVLASCLRPKFSDVPILLEMLKAESMAAEVEKMYVSFLNVMSKHLTLVDRISQGLLEVKDNFDFWAALLPALTSLREELASSLSTISTDATQGPPPAGAYIDQQRVSILIEQSFQRLISLWNQQGAQVHCNEFRARFNLPLLSTDEAVRINTPRVKRVIEVIKQCLLHRRMDLCVPLLKSVLQDLTPERQDYRAHIYSPLISDLVDLLQRHNISTLAPLFASFFRILIGHQLHTIPPLGLKIRPMACKCEH